MRPPHPIELQRPRAEDPSERVAREDLILFINACFSCTGQAEFYGGADGQEVAIGFLHEYILGNYRRLYARTLAAGINHFNQGLILLNLLATGRDVATADRAEEGALIAAALRALPPQRALKILRQLRERRVNNRRARATIRDYLRRRPDPVFDAVKYRAQVRALAAHAHLRLPGELGPFVFEGVSPRRVFQTPLLEAFRRANYADEAIFALPYTIAEGLAQRRRVPRDVFLRRIEPNLTAAERLRLQGAAEREEVRIEVDLRRAPLTKLALYVLSLPLPERAARRQELDDALREAARRALRRSPLRLGRVAAILDRSYSSSGSLEKRRRPLGVALAASYLLREAADEYVALWTPAEPGDEVLVTARGQTDLATPLLRALEPRPDLVVIVSDGYENDPPGAAGELVRIFRRHIDRERRTSIIHANPVLDAENLSPRTLGPALPTLGLRDAEDLLTLIGFARFADGTAPLGELERYLALRMERLLRGRGAGADAAIAAASAASAGGAEDGDDAGAGAEIDAVAVADSTDGAAASADTDAADGDAARTDVGVAS